MKVRTVYRMPLAVAVQVSTGEMTRVLSAVVGAETTGGDVFKHKGKTYVWANMQHPYEGVADMSANPGGRAHACAHSYV